MRVAFGRMVGMACSGLGLALVVAAFGGLAQAGPPVITPEIDPGSMGSALTLLIGGAMLLTGKGRKG